MKSSRESQTSIALRACRAKSGEVRAALKSLTRVKDQVAFADFCHEQITASVAEAKRVHRKGKFARMTEKIQFRVAGLPATATPFHIARDAQAAAVFACEDDDTAECQAWMGAATAQINRVIELLEKKP